MATTRIPVSPSGTKKPTYRAQTMAMAAMIPECIVQNIAQPQRKPSAGENASRRNTYTPPDSGCALASSAHTRAPKSVRMPETAQTA